MVKNSLIFLPIFLFAINCNICHNGRKAVDLHKLSKKEIKEKLYEFRSGKGNKLMQSFAKTMSNKEIEEISKKYGK